MIQSQYVRDILELLLDGDKQGMALKKQIDFLSDTKYEYTDSGVFVTFSASNEIFQNKIENHSNVIDGINIESPELKMGAQAVVHIKDGIVYELEIIAWSCEYPKKDISSYTLKQVWNGSPQRTISRNL